MLTIAPDARPRIARCETCRRHILFLRAIFGLRLSTPEVRLPLPTAIMIFVACVGAFCVLLSVLMPYLSGLAGFVWVNALAIIPFLGIVMILNLVYEGYLSIRTGIMKQRNYLIRGRWAILLGLIVIGMSIFVLVFLYVTFGNIKP